MQKLANLEKKKKENYEESGSNEADKKEENEEKKTWGEIFEKRRKPISSLQFKTNNKNRKPTPKKPKKEKTKIKEYINNINKNVDIENAKSSQDIRSYFGKLNERKVNEISTSKRREIERGNGDIDMMDRTGEWGKVKVNGESNQPNFGMVVEGGGGENVNSADENPPQSVPASQP